MADKKILILGASGFVGGHMWELLGPDRAIAATFSRDEGGTVHFDALTMELRDIVPSFDEIAHAMVFYGETHPDRCANDPEWSEALNVESTKRVIDCLVEQGVPFTFTSSEFVFDGSQGKNTENSPTNPINLYGEQKLRVEKYIEETNGDWTVMRLGKVFEADGANAKLFSGWIEEIESGQKIRVADDQVFSPILVNDVVVGCLRAAKMGVRGLYHLCGTRPYGRDQLLTMLVEEMRNYNPIDVIVEKCSIDDFDLPELRPKDCSMLPDKLVSATGLEITQIEDVCRDTVRRHFEGV